MKLRQRRNENQLLLETIHAYSAAITETRIDLWYQNCLAHHSEGHKPNSYEPAVSHSTTPAIPTTDRDDKQIEAEVKRTTEALKLAARLLMQLDRTITARITPTGRMPDPEERWCTNKDCDRPLPFTMLADDRPRDADGRCDRCRQYVKAHPGVEWSPKRQKATA